MAWALRARAPVAAGSLPRATRSAPKAGALRARAPTCAPRVTAHVVSWGGVGMSKTSCAARCSRGSVQGVLRAPAEGEGRVAHREDLAATASATLERSTGTVAHGKRAARERRRRRSKVSRRRRAGHAPPARRGRRVRVPRAFKRPAKTLWWVVVAATPNYWCTAPSPATCARGDAAVFTDAHVSLTSRLRARDPQGHSPAAGDRCGFVVFDTVDLR